ncbi:hypothetical protein KIJ96_19640 (plasmid) [Pseudoalteromonas piscicida]|nr:hypothetical protein [Pseudoalteromonas piscicida]UDM64206.1 hypothetical protein KIJ96_19640 [Pseudoalteromonas piscicida]
MRAASEELGEEAARIFVEQNYPGATPLRSKLLTDGKQGQFDQLYQTEDGRLLVIEAKGGSATWGSRMAGKRRAQQGSREYMDSIFKNYEDKLREYLDSPNFGSDKHEVFTNQVEQLEDMIDAYKSSKLTESIDYIGVQQRVRDNGLVEVIDITEFDIIR